MKQSKWINHRAGIFVLNQVKRFRWEKVDRDEKNVSINYFEAFNILQMHPASNVKFFLQASIDGCSGVNLQGKFSGPKEKRYLKLEGRLKSASDPKQEPKPEPEHKPDLHHDWIGQMKSEFADLIIEIQRQMSER